jgi:hypothetical protein
LLASYLTSIHTVRFFDEPSHLSLFIKTKQAIIEILKRHIRDVDKVTYEQAEATFIEIETKNSEYAFLLALPFQMGVFATLGSCIISVPLVFHLPTVSWFNEWYVTADIPPAKDLETALEVGAWSWNWWVHFLFCFCFCACFCCRILTHVFVSFLSSPCVHRMEPVMGTATFGLLCMQYLRQHLDHLGFEPYTARLKKKRGLRLLEAFPQYESELLLTYSKSTSFSSMGTIKAVQVSRY